MRHFKSIQTVVSSLALCFIMLAAFAFQPDLAIGQGHKESPMSVLVQSDHPVGRHLFGDWYVVAVTAPTEGEAVRQVKQWSGVREAEPDAKLHLHEAYCQPPEWYVENFGQFGRPNSVDVDTDAWGAWEILDQLIPTNPVRIAIMDSGVKTYHPRFQGVNFFAEKKLADDMLSTNDVFGHGTAVAGVVAAMLPNPSWYELGSYRVFDEYGIATWSALIEGVEMAIADGAKVINFSGGSTLPAKAVRTCLASHPDVLFVFSAGNGQGAPYCPDCGNEQPEYPAQYHDLPNVVSVAAIDQSGALTTFTNTGALLAAPGQFIFTSMCGCELEPIQLCQPANYGFLNGTSFSAPIVTAICAGRWLIHPQETAAEVRDKLLASVDVDRLYTNKLISRGRANFQNILELP